MATATETPAPAAEQPGTAMVKAEGKAVVRYGTGGVVLSSLAEMFRFAELAYQAGIAPKSLDSPQKIAVAIQFGAEFGLAPMASLRAVKVINGMPSFSGDAALALVTASGKLRDNPIDPATGQPIPVKQYLGEDDDYRCRVTLSRVGVAAPFVEEFSVKDAKLADLWGKTGPWRQYPKRMLYYRPLGFILRDNFADILMGVVIAEELEDYPPAALSPSAQAQIAAARPATVDPLMETIGVTAPEATKPAVMPTPPSSPADEPGAAEAAEAFTDRPLDVESAPCCGGFHAPSEPCPPNVADEKPKGRKK